MAENVNEVWIITPQETSMISRQKDVEIGCFIMVGAGDNVDVLQGNGQFTFKLPVDIKVTGVELSVDTPSKIDNVVVDLTADSTSILQDSLVVQNDAFSTEVPVAPVEQNIAAGTEISVDVASTGQDATGMVVWITGEKI